MVSNETGFTELLSLQILSYLTYSCVAVFTMQLVNDRFELKNLIHKYFHWHLLDFVKSR